MLAIQILQVLDLVTGSVNLSTGSLELKVQDFLTHSFLKTVFLYLVTGSLEPTEHKE